MKQYKVCFLLIVVISIYLPLVLNGSELIVRDLQVKDIPFDDGTGLQLSWVPLARDHRIIEYRVYRGISPDSLFHIGTIDVNPILGVTSPKLFFTDSGYNDFVSFFSPAKLRKESQQPDNSPLYRAMPRDPEIYAKYLTHYSVLAMIPRRDFFYRSRPIEVIEDGNRNIFAGLPFYRLDGLLSMLIPDQTYYYTVLAVDHQRGYHPSAPIVSGVPRINPPEKPISFSTAVITDLESIQFEWVEPQHNSQVYLRNIYLIPDDKLASMKEYIGFQEKIGADQNSSTQETKPSNPGLLILSTDTPYPHIRTIETTNGMVSIVNEEEPYPLDRSEPVNFSFVMALIDYQENESYSEIVSPRKATSDLLPTLPSYIIEDKPDDQGDYNQLLFGRPLVFLTQGSFLNRTRNRILLNYDYTDNRLARIDRINFQFYDHDGNLIHNLDDIIPNKIIRLNIPDAGYLDQGIRVEMRPQYQGKMPADEYLLSQTITYNSDFGLFEFSELILDEEQISDYTYYIVKRSRTDADFYLTQALSPFSRSFDDSIPYETTVYKMVEGIDKDTELLYFDSLVTLLYDRDLESYISTTLFAAEVSNNIVQLQEMVNFYEEQLAVVDAEDAAINEFYFDFYGKLLAIAQGHPLLQEINSINNQRQRAKLLANVSERNSRSFEYIFAKTDGEALFIKDDYYGTNGENYFYPTPDWFDSSKLATLIASLIFGFLVFVVLRKAAQGKTMFIRPIAGLEEIDNAIGRATEMGKPILFVPGIGYIEDIATLAGLSILSNVARKAAEYDTKILVPVADYIVLPVAIETVREAHLAAGRPDTFNRNDIFYIAGDQFAFVAGVNGVMLRQKTVANFYLGVFFAEALIMTETGNASGAVQIAGSDSTTQIPFFITTCDYTLIGEELYGASAYLSKDPMILGTLKAQDYAKIIIICFITVGTLLSTMRITFLIKAFPSQ